MTQPNLKRILFFSSLLFSNMLIAQATIEDLLSVPFPTSLASSADGKHIAWVFNDRGMRNVFMADAPEFKVRKLTAHIADDGIDIGDLRFSPDGNNILFTEGKPNNGKGEAANPALLQVKTELTAWSINTIGGNLN